MVLCYLIAQSSGMCNSDEWAGVPSFVLVMLNCSAMDMRVSAWDGMSMASSFFASGFSSGAGG